MALYGEVNDRLLLTFFTKWKIVSAVQILRIRNGPGYTFVAKGDPVDIRELTW